MIFLEGFLIGIGMVVFIGPVFFFLLKSTLEGGFWSGVSVASGIIISDILCVILCSYGIADFVNQENNKFWLGIIASILLLGLGLKYIIDPKIKNKNFKKIATNKIAYFIQGFLINFVNPFVFLVWIGVIAIAKNKFQLPLEYSFYITSVLSAIFFTDLLKVILAHKITPYINPMFLSKLYRTIGILLIIFGLRILIYIF